MKRRQFVRIAVGSSRYHGNYCKTRLITTAVVLCPEDIRIYIELYAVHRAYGLNGTEGTDFFVGRSHHPNRGVPLG